MFVKICNESCPQDEEEDEEKPLKSSEDADTHLLFTKPTDMGNSFST